MAIINPMDNLKTQAEAGYGAFANAMQEKKAAASNVAPEQAESVKSLVKYLEDKPITKDDSDSFSSTMKSAATGVALFEAPSGLSWLKKAKGLKVFNAGQTAEEAVSCAAKLKEYAAPVTDSLRGIAKGSGKLSTRLSNYMNSIKEFQSNSANLKATMKTAKTTGKTVAEIAKPVAESAEAAAKTGKVAQAFGKVKTAVGKPFAALGKTKVGSKLASVFSKAGKATKGTGMGAFAVIGGGIELATEVVPTFKELGAKAGFKQVGKSAVKVGADIGGWALGAKGGAALGAAIGSIFPGIGTAIGTAIGTLVGGIVGSWGAGKIAKKVTGPTEREKAAAKNVEAQSQEITSNNKDLESLKALTMQKIEQSIQANGGKVDAETQKAIEELEKLNSNNPFVNFSTTA